MPRIWSFSLSPFHFAASSSSCLHISFSLFHLVHCSSTWRYFSFGILCLPRFIGTLSYISDLWHCPIKTRNAPRSSSSLSGMTRFHGPLPLPQWLLRSTYLAHLPLSSHQRGMLFSQIVRLGPEGMASDSTFSQCHPPLSDKPAAELQARSSHAASLC